MIDRRSTHRLVAFIAVGALASACGFGSPTGETRNDTVSFDLGSAKTARVELQMGSGDLTVAGGTSKLMDARFSYNVEAWKPAVDYNAATGDLKILQPKSTGSFGNTVNDWDVTLNGEVPLEITANLGAGEATLDLGQLNLNRVEMNIGAGEVKMDLRGQPKHDYAVHIRGGVGNTVVYLPKDAGISATATKGIGDLNTEGLEQRDGVWINPDRVGAPVTVRLDVKGGIGTIRLVR